MSSGCCWSRCCPISGASGSPVERPPDGGERGAVADPDGVAVAGSAGVLRPVEDRVQPASALVCRWDVGAGAQWAAARLRRWRGDVGGGGGLHRGARPSPCGASRTAGQRLSWVTPLCAFREVRAARTSIALPQVTATSSTAAPSPSPPSRSGSATPSPSTSGTRPSAWAVNLLAASSVSRVATGARGAVRGDGLGRASRPKPEAFALYDANEGAAQPSTESSCETVE